MDSLSQALFGSVTAVIATGGRHPRRAALAGALLGTLPDLDVLVPQSNALEAMIDHRTWSHSWLMQAAISPFLALGLHAIDSRLQQRRRRRHPEAPAREKGWSRGQWFLLVWLVLFTHSILDAVTIYGTWLFWPLGDQPVMGGSIFIIDPLFTLPLLWATILLIRRRPGLRPRRTAAIALVVACGYLGWGVFAKQHVERIAAGALATRGITPDRIVATPTPFNSLLWRILVLDGDRYLEGFHGLHESGENPRFCIHPRNPHLVAPLLPNEDLRKFIRFNHGFHAFRESGDFLLGEDLRMGSTPYFFFSFVFAESEAGDSPETRALSGDTTARYKAVIPGAYQAPFDGRRFFSWLWARLGDSSIPPLAVSDAGCI